MKLKKTTTSITAKTLFYLIIFSVAILLFLFFFRSILFKYSYERYQEKKVSNIAKSISTSSLSNINSELESLAFDNSVCIEYFSSSEKRLFNHLMVGCGLNKNNNQIKQLMDNMKNTSNSIETVKLVDNVSHAKAILAGIVVNDGIVFVYSPLEDLNDASVALESQMWYVTIIVIVLASIISYFLSNKITKPIRHITEQAKLLGSGNYDTKFESSDIEEINELADTLNHVSSDLSKIDELRRDLMANVSHDLKTPLTMIKAYAEKVKDLSYKDKEKMDKDLNVIMDEADRLTILVNDILELSKMQADAEVMHLEKFDLCDVIHEVMKRYDILISNEDYKFNVIIPEKVMVKADKKKIEQVIYNLINNAINYTGDDKLVTIKVTNHKKEVLVEVIDTGKGIKVEDIPYIWDKYYKKDKNHQRNVVSTGIGLSIVKEALDKHGFTYGVTSSLGCGSTFYFKIKK